MLEWGNWSWESHSFAVLSAVQTASLVPQIRDFNGEGEKTTLVLANVFPS